MSVNHLEYVYSCWLQQCVCQSRQSIRSLFLTFSIGWPLHLFLGGGGLIEASVSPTGYRVLFINPRNYIPLFMSLNFVEYIRSTMYVSLFDLISKRADLGVSDDQEQYCQEKKRKERGDDHVIS